MFALIKLPYNSLAPVISDQTLSFHHGKHLQTYVDNLNKLIAGTEPIQEELTALLEAEFSLPYFEFVYDEHIQAAYQHLDMWMNRANKTLEHLN